MKNLLLLISVVAIFASSCSSKIGIAKRKYGKGYYVSVSKQPKDLRHSETKAKLVVKPSNKEAEPVNTVIVPPSAVGTENTQKTASAPVLSSPNSKVAENQRPSNYIASAVKDGKSNSVSQVNTVKRLPLNLPKSKSMAEDSLTLVLYIILCLFPFVNLIPVYLHQGKKITNDFWITLILDILLILGVIYSILVVLDILSFA